MRLGTKSCSECRRRKVRCIFPDDSKICKECVLHDVPCTPQVSQAPAKGKECCSVLRSRVEHLESLIAEICLASGAISDTSASVNIDDAAQTLLSRLRHESQTPSDKIKDTPSYIAAGSTISDITTSSIPLIDPVPFQQAPLLNFLKECMIITDSNNSEAPPQSQNIKPLIETHRRRCEELIPGRSSLILTLDATQRYWGLWPVLLLPSSGPDEPSMSPAHAAEKMLWVAMESGKPGRMAKVITWLALCLQQLPRDVAARNQNLATCASDLVFSFLSESDELVSIDSDLGGSLASLEALMLQLKCYANMGRPRKSWLTIRRAMNLAISLGLHQASQPPDPERASLWMKIWQYDRQLSLAMGFPHALAEPHPTFSQSFSNEPIEFKIMFHISMICGHIGERNQNHLQAKYAATAKIDDELADLEEMIPRDWWAINSRTLIPLELFFLRQSLKLYFYYTKQLLHLPYMLRAATDPRYEHSRQRVLEAVEGMIRCYHETRSHPDGALVICFLFDTYAFNAGVVLAADLISQQRARYSAPAPEVEAEEQRWGLVRTLVERLREVAVLLDYAVAEQGAQLLQYLCEARHGAYDGPETYDVTVPCFGRVRIRRPAALTTPGQQQVETPDDAAPSAYKPSTVELSTNIFDHSYIQNPKLDADFDIDWTQVFAEEISYDWNGIFEFHGTS
ncbi:hypothetical protein BX600DRAFT_437170 [Xylariales sp. PMI_506]|nr:hypothetical protein BX600DRAFT_437170 [Xylariales sp. PMI_506]